MLQTTLARLFRTESYRWTRPHSYSTLDRNSFAASRQCGGAGRRIAFGTWVTRRTPFGDGDVMHLEVESHIDGAFKG